MPKMNDSELKAIIEAKLNNALGWLGGSLSKTRMLSLAYYRGDLFGNEQEGRSKVVSRDVAEAIDSAMPSLIKMFISSETVVVFSPRRKEDEEAAKQATDYINWVWQTLPNSFDLLQTWIKSGLLSQLGVVKSWWDDSEDVKQPAVKTSSSAPQKPSQQPLQSMNQVSMNSQQGQNANRQPTTPPNAQTPLSSAVAPQGNR